MAAIPLIELNTGAKILAIGLGGGPDDFTPAALVDAKRWFLTAFEAGYRHFDTAYFYGTEPALGAALRASKVPREEVFITTKLPPHHGRYVERSLNESLSRLDVDYVDLYLMHWPQALTYPAGYDLPPTVEEIWTSWKLDEEHTFNETWAEMERLHASGKARAIGVSNFSIKTLEELFKTAKIVPAVNQIEMHPYHTDTELLEYCRKKGIVKLRDDPVIVGLAEKYKVQPTQIILAWHVARGVVAVPKSSNAGRQKETLSLSTEDVASVSALDRKQRCEQWGTFGPDGKFFGWTREQLGW
ncbi:NADP-dependent oxidoreductase domain-containing protein [Mycena leptocephala]|nr:NADP-dependent oxidoreductase domain-containing protein [Mycena leptocephala]